MPSAQPTTQECISSNPTLPTMTHIASMPQVGSRCTVFGHAMWEHGWLTVVQPKHGWSLLTLPLKMSPESLYHSRKS